MPNPSSSATSPSPPAHPSYSPTITHSVDDLEDKDQRKRAVDKFLARAEIAMVTRALRARLSYASYKATHNIPHVPLRDLEAQALPHSQPTAAFSRSQAAKRKAAAAPGTPRRGAMPPPSPRTGYATYQETRSTPTPSSSLYASLLAPTPIPTHTARTVHNPSDPPVPAPVRPISSPSPHVRVVKASPRNGKGKASVPPSPAQLRRAAGKGKRKQHEDTASVASSSRYADGDVDMEGVDDADPDMKAAATLTSLLMHHHRPSMSTGTVGSPRGSVASPRGSIDASHRHHGHTHSGQFTQSAARGESHLSVSSFNSSAPGAYESPRTLTPPPHEYRDQNGSPRTHALGASGSSFVPTNSSSISTSAPAASDSEAANLMLFLATSPSPVRPSGSRDIRDEAAYRILGGTSASSGAQGGLMAKGRVLFSGGGEGHTSPRGAGGDLRHPPLGVGLRRGEGSPNFSFGVAALSPAMENGGATSGSNGGLLPPPALPGKPNTPAPGSPLRASAVPRHGGSSRLSSVGVPGTNVSGAQGAEFNFSDFINASPLPPNYGNTSDGAQERPGPITDATVAAYNASSNPRDASRSPHPYPSSQPALLPPAQQPSTSAPIPTILTSPKAGASNNGRGHGLRADVGRKLFEEEQMRYREREKEKAMLNVVSSRGGVPDISPRDVSEPAKSVTIATSLGAGIELSGT